jgi:hypothetical protein
MEPILDAEFAKHRVIVALDCKIAITNRPAPWAYRTVGGITQAKILAAACLMIERVCGRTGSPFKALETGAWLSFVPAQCVRLLARPPVVTVHEARFVN